MILMADITVVRSPDQHRYEAMVDGKVAGFAQFRSKPGQVIFWHTEVDPAFEGKGVGSVLAKHALQDVRARGEKVVAQCPFIASYIKRHQEFQDLLIED
jgi:predicted GNAT family acetyltransferase